MQKFLLMLCLSTMPLFAAPKRKIKPPVFYFCDEYNEELLAALIARAQIDKRDTKKTPTLSPDQPVSEGMQTEPRRYTTAELVSVREEGASFTPVIPEAVRHLLVKRPFYKHRTRR